MVSVISETKCVLGEGPHWSNGENALYWVDIEQNLLFRWTASTGQQQWRTPFQSSAVLDSHFPLVTLATETGILQFDTDSREYSVISSIEADDPERRSNEAKCDPKGAVWFSTLERKQQHPTGRLYRVHDTGQFDLWKTDLYIPNTLAWSPDGTVMYFADSKRRTIYKAGYCIRTGEAKSPELWVSFKDGQEVPDGSSIDSDGNLWTAMWDGWRIACHSPDGQIRCSFRIPVQRPTSCTFGNRDCTTLYVTTASAELDCKQLESQPLAGHVLAIDLTQWRAGLGPSHR